MNGPAVNLKRPWEEPQPQLALTRRILKACCSRDSTRPALAYLYHDAKRKRLFSTDGHRLAYVSVAELGCAPPRGPGPFSPDDFFVSGAFRRPQGAATWEANKLAPKVVPKAGQLHTTLKWSIPYWVEEVADIHGAFVALEDGGPRIQWNGPRTAPAIDLRLLAPLAEEDVLLSYGGFDEGLLAVPGDSKSPREAWSNPWFMAVMPARAEAVLGRYQMVWRAEKKPEAA